jgi:hypothetical protein
MNTTKRCGQVSALAIAALAANASAQQAVRPAATEPPPATAPAQAQPARANSSAWKPAFPHPLISEVLFAVPSGSDGDQTKDGVRSATGEEFVELCNPHDRPIELRGYRLVEGQVQTRRNQQRESQPSSEIERDTDRLDFTFPALTLQPGEVVLVFSGFETSIAGSVGTREKAGEKNDDFAGAYVFSFEASTKYVALSNSNDMVQLLSPSGDGVHALAWDFRKDDKQPAQNAATPPAPPTQPSSDPNATQQTTQQTTEQSGPSDAGVVRSRSPREPTPKPTPMPTQGQGKQGSPRSTSRPSPTPKRLPKHADASIAHLETITDPTWREGSLQRDTTTGTFLPHTRIDGRLASPGEYSGDVKVNKP